MSEVLPVLPWAFLGVLIFASGFGVGAMSSKDRLYAVITAQRDYIYKLQEEIADLKLNR